MRQQATSDSNASSVRRGLTALLLATLVGTGLPSLVSTPAAAAETTPDTGPVFAAAYQGTDKTSLPAAVAVEGSEHAVTWAAVDTSTAYATRTVVGTLDTGDTVTAEVEVVPEGIVYFIDAGDPSSNSHAAVAALAGPSGDGTLVNQIADQRYEGAAAWGYDLDGTAGDNDDWVTKNDVGSTKDSNGLYADDDPAAYVLELASGNYSITVGAWEWWNSPGRTQKIELVSPDGTVTPVGANQALSRDAINTVSTVVKAAETGTYRLRFSEVAGGYPLVSWIGVAPVRSLVTAPSITPSSGAFTSATSVSISTPTPGAEIFYTLDGTTPTPETGTAYSEPFLLTASATIAAVAAVGDDVSDAAQASLTITPWSLTATAFKLAGERDADNVKITWDRVTAATRYEVYRDEDLIADSTGDTVDDYDLGVGAEHVYTVRAFVGDSPLATSEPAAVTTFRPTGTPAVWDNTTGGNDLGLPQGIEIDGTYYSYSASSSGTTTTIHESVSSDGRDFGSGRLLATLPDTKLEGFGAHYNPATGNVVIAAHRENAADYADAEIYLAEIEPGGTLTETFSGRPNGLDSRDMSFFVDDDGRAYLISATNTNADIAIHLLDKNWTDVESLVTVAFEGQSRETPGIIKKDGIYYFFSSKASGWYPSQAMFASSASLAGPWSALREIGNAATYGAQSNSVDEFGPDNFGLYAYRWGAQFDNPEPTGNYPRLLPVSFNDGFATAEYYSTVEHYPSIGLVPVQAGRSVSLGADVSVTVDSASANNDERVITDGADLAGSGFFRSDNEGSSTAYPFDVVIDLGTPARIAEIDTTTFLHNGSEAAYKYTISGSQDGGIYTPLADRTTNARVGYLIDPLTDSTPYRFVKVTVLGVTKVKDSGSVTGWGDGIYEVAAFGTPTATPVADLTGGTYYTAQSVQLSTNASGAEIRYTLDGSAPNATSTLYTGPIALAEAGDYTLKAVAILDGAPSSAFTGSYTIAAGSTPVGLADPPAYAVIVGEEPDLPDTVRVETADGEEDDAAVEWDLGGLTFTKPYKTYTIYGTVQGLPGYVTGTIETLAPDTIYYVDSGTAGQTSTAYLGAENLLGTQLLNSASDQEKTDSNDWGYSGIDGSETSGDSKEVNGHYGANDTGHSIEYTLQLPTAGDYTFAGGIYEWWSAGDRQVQVTMVDSQGRTIDIAQSAAGAITETNRAAPLTGAFTVEDGGEGTVTLKFTNIGWQGATVTWLALADGHQSLDLTVDTVAPPTISPTADAVYGAPQQISIEAPAGAVAYYTTDGSTPTRVNGTRYTDAFTLSSSATVRAVAIANGVSSDAVTADYTIVVQEGDYTSVPVGQPWFDTSGTAIQAHGGGFLEHDGWYYWVGEDKTHNSASFNGVNLYRSQDLLNWEFVSKILVPEAEGLDCNITGAATCKVERPKLLYNEATDRFVLWGHWETEDSYAASQVVVATSDTVGGQYEVQYHGRPGAGVVWDLEQVDEIQATVTDGTYDTYDDAEAAYRTAGHTPAGHQSRDFTVYVDDDGKGWLISAEAHVQLRIYPLTNDFLATEYEDSYPLFVDDAREAAAITYQDGYYYLLTSGQSGWYPNQLKYAYTTDLSDPDGWSANENVGNNTTFKSQPTYVMQVQKPDGGNSLVYMGDRWNPGVLGNSTYVWLPMTIDSDTHGIDLRYYDRWSLDVNTGEVVSTAPSLVSRGKPASATPSGSLSAGYADAVADPGEHSLDSPAGAANDGILYTTDRYDNSHYYYPGDTTSWSWQVDLQERHLLDRLDISWRSYNGSETYSTYVISGSDDGVTWTPVLDRSANKTVGFTSDHIAGAYRYVRVEVSGVVNDHNQSSAGWASGLVEVEVYGTAVGDLDPEAIQISGDAELAVGDSAQLTALVDPTDAYQGVSWSTGDPSILTVNDNGLVQAVGEGEAVITATSALIPGVTADFPITVIPAAQTRTLDSISLTGPAKTAYAVDEALDLSGLVVTAKYSNGDESVVTADAQATGFDSSAPATGQVVIVSYTDGGVTRTATFTVTITDAEVPNPGGETPQPPTPGEQPPSSTAGVTGSLAPDRVAPGGSLTVTASGFQPSEEVEVWLYSTPSYLGTVTANSVGDVTALITVPATFSYGTHHVVLVGKDSGAIFSAAFQVVPIGQLSATGGDVGPTLLFAGYALALLIAGTVLFTVRGRRRRAEEIAMEAITT